MPIFWQDSTNFYMAHIIFSNLIKGKHIDKATLVESPQNITLNIKIINILDKLKFTNNVILFTSKFRFCKLFPFLKLMCEYLWVVATCAHLSTFCTLYLCCYFVKDIIIFIISLLDFSMVKSKYIKNRKYARLLLYCPF